MSRLVAPVTALLVWLAERAEARRLRQAACTCPPCGCDVCTDPDWPVPW